MSDNNLPEFSITPLNSKPAGKLKKKTTQPKTAPRRTRTASVASIAKTKKVGEQLTAIYEDDNGKLPNMDKIEMKSGHHILRKLFGLVIILGLLTAAAWAGFFLMPHGESLSTVDVNLTMTGDTNLMLGATTTVTISYQNNQKIKLNDATLSVRYPAGFTFISSEPVAKNPGNTEWDLGTLASRQKGTVTLIGKIYAPINNIQAWRAFLSYRPDNFQSNLQTMATFENKIATLPYSLQLTAPDKIKVGADTTFTITVKNSSADWMEKLMVIPVLPANFKITSSAPKIAKDNWAVTTASNATTTATQFPITFTGQLADQLDPTATFEAQLVWVGPSNQKQIIATTSISAEIIKNSLTLALAINGSTSRVASFPDDMLGMTLTLHNSSPDDATAIQLTLTVDAPSYQKQSVFDWANLTDKYDGDVKGTQLSDTRRRGEITWTSKNWSDLKTVKAGQEISLDVNLPAKNLKEIDWNKVKEFLATVSAQASYTTKGKAGQVTTINPVEITFNSDLSLAVRDDVKNDSGAEQHQITWVINNSLHALNNVTLNADIYGDTTVQLPDTPPAGTLNYDTNTKHLTWTIPTMTDSMDVLALPFTVTLNKKDPTQNALVSKVRLQAIDAVTGEELNVLANEVAPAPVQ